MSQAQKLLCVVGLTLTGAAQADSVIALGSITAPATSAFSNSAVSLHAANLPALASPYNFLDQVTFTLTSGAAITSLTASFNYTPSGAGPAPTFGIDNLQINLLDSSSSVVSPGWLTVTPGVPFTTLISTTPTTTLAAGNYTLQVRGTLYAPGSYSGTLIAAAPAAVPLPAALPLLALGLGALGVTGKRRRKFEEAA
ncbi:MAG: FxDxF family PEP-CTERM protein [Rhizobacter sp.]